MDNKILPFGGGKKLLLQWLFRAKGKGKKVSMLPFAATL